jgi:predicted nuclease of restriction endonuclease-like (RecB) superfamily
MPSLMAQSEGRGIVLSPTAQLLSWTHYERLLQVADPEARDWYASEAYDQSWSVRTLQRNISSQFASKYKLYLPTEEELRAEIEAQKEFYYLQKQNNDESKN